MFVLMVSIGCTNLIWERKQLHRPTSSLKTSGSWRSSRWKKNPASRVVEVAPKQSPETPPLSEATGEDQKAGGMEAVQWTADSKRVAIDLGEGEESGEGEGPDMEGEESLVLGIPGELPSVEPSAYYNNEEELKEESIEMRPSRSALGIPVPTSPMLRSQRSGHASPGSGLKSSGFKSSGSDLPALDLSSLRTSKAVSEWDDEPVYVVPEGEEKQEDSRHRHHRRHHRHHRHRHHRHRRRHRHHHDDSQAVEHHGHDDDEEEQSDERSEEQPPDEGPQERRP